MKSVMKCSVFPSKRHGPTVQTRRLLKGYKFQLRKGKLANGTGASSFEQTVPRIHLVTM
jgi:hypothetical protein